MIRLFAAVFSVLFLLCQPVLALQKHDHDESAHEETHKEHEHHDDHAEDHDDHDHENGEDDHSHHEASVDGVRTVHAWIQATSGKSALLFVEIQNKSDKDVKITGGEADIAESVELVGFQLKDGETEFVALPSVPVKAGKELVLAPNGLALRLNGLKQPFKKGEEFEIEIEFDFGHIEMHVQVEAANATRHSHAGHQH
ncbi:copper chaperone PCu(A)C [Roseibium aggregatum]|uniref:Copper chaperone PCu(A)C n=1 Tax=Roseibium aggregatum TaxID=187304 RepID=A0A939J527_9HYPH|nr:copper chaperone PCu(A)C [Roseibium aggregatum]MBN9671790.1 copper chaperone PCu(A)C [Roseibium aggregatum]